MKKLIVIQARVGSSRLPNKVLLPVKGRPLLLRMIQRVAATTVDCDLVVATTTKKQDDVIEKLCGQIGVKCFRGHPTDLLDRHYRAALEARANVIIKIPSDCPLIDPRIIDRVVGFYDAHCSEYDYVSNLHPASYPDGNDVEVIPFPTLEKTWREARRPFEREHTTPFIWESPALFRIGNVLWEQGLDYSMSHRWTIDYPEDYLFIRNVYDHLWRADGPPFSMQEILYLLEREPVLRQINLRYAGVNWYHNYLSELKTITSAQTRKAS
ncbi:MAG TPA: glycosyltransferase family protein [Bacteroidota bacterium]|nr:glycosyltransferase family protein [Bacteroidota bacterium]